MSILIFALSCTAAAQDNVKSIDLPHFLPYIPAGEGRDLFATGCLSCHSTRYISMQPIVPQAKWEENVKKMIKTYGAPLAEENVTPLAKYLVNMQHAEPDPLARTIQVVAPREIRLENLSDEDASRGQKVYATACASCHGKEGRGDGQNMGDLLPRATDFHSGHFSASAVSASITRGVPGTAMPAFPTLSDDDVRAVTAYTLSLGEKPQQVAPPDEEVKKVFTVNCASCHGATGGGDGFNAPTLARLPTNFHERQPTAEHALSIISDGAAGTAMPSWKAKLTDPQRKMLADYVRSLYAQPAK